MLIFLYTCSIQSMYFYLDAILVPGRPPQQLRGVTGRGVELIFGV